MGRVPLSEKEWQKVKVTKTLNILKRYFIELLWIACFCGALTLDTCGASWFWDPETLVQCRNSWTSPKSIGEGAGGLLGRRPGSLENVSCSRATSRLHRCKSGVALEQETFSRLPGLPPKRLLAPSPIDLGEVQGIRGLYQAIRVAILVAERHHAWNYVLLRLKTLDALSAGAWQHLIQAIAHEAKSHKIDSDGTASVWWKVMKAALIPRLVVVAQLVSQHYPSHG